jgi:hypothetical protein
MGRRVGPEGYAAQTTAFSKSLGKALDNISFTHLAEPLMESIAEVAMEAAYDSLKENAPVGDPAKEPFGSHDLHPGNLRDSAYKLVEKKGTSITAIVGIPHSKVPYVWTVIVGSRSHNPNGFMTVARDDGFDAVRKMFRKLTIEQFQKLNRG